MRFQKGDQGAILLLLSRYQQPVFNFLLWHTGNAAKAESLRYEVFRAVIAQAAGLHEGSRVLPHVYEECARVVENVNRTPLGSGAPLVDDALGQMVGEQRTAFLMRQLLDLPFKQIADTLGCDAKAVKRRVRHVLVGASAEWEQIGQIQSHWADAKERQACAEIVAEERLVDFVFGELDETQTSHIGRHVAACTRCGKMLNDLQERRSQLVFPEMVAGPLVEVTRLFPPPEDKPAPKGTLPVLWIVGFAVLLLVIVAVLVLK